jgi:hypothetical protein
MTFPAPKPATEALKPATPVTTLKRQAKAVVAADKAKPAVTMRDALTDLQLLGSVLNGDTWRAWHILLIAIMGEKLTADEREAFKELTGRECEPLALVEEFWGIIGRRGGKSRAMAALVVFLACLRAYGHVTVAGERPTVLLLAANVKQAGVALGYVVGILESTPLLAAMVRGKTADSIELSNGVVIEVRPASFRGLRGITAVAVVADEIAFWYNEDSQSANPDSEIIAALRPALATTQGPLIAISSPYARRGELWSTYQRHFGAKGDPKILVAKAPSRTMNPSLPESVVTRALERDAAAASAEYMAEFRSDFESLVSREVVEAAVVPGRFETPPMWDVRYFGAVDAAGGSGGDAMSLAIAHHEGDVVVLDAVREVRPPFSPDETVGDFRVFFKRYRIHEVTGDRWGSEFVRERFQKLGITFNTADRTKSEFYKEILPLLNSKRVELLDLPRLQAQLLNLERKTARGGRDSIDHPQGSNHHDDLINAAAIALVIAAGIGRAGGFDLDLYLRAFC